MCKQSADIEGTSRLFSLARMNALRTSLTTYASCCSMLANMYTFTQQPTARFTQASFESVGTADMRLFNCKIYANLSTQLQDIPYIEAKKRFTFWGFYAVQSGAGLTTIQGNLLSLLSECHIPEDSNVHALNYRSNCMGSQIFHNPRL